jgi:thiol:disulfide interchange protein
MEDFVTQHDIDHVRHIADVDGDVWQRFGVVGQPAWVFIDGESGESERVLGALSTAELETRLESLASDG